HPEFGTRLGPAVINVVAMTPDELETAAQRPALRTGVTLEPALVAELLTDVVGEPGALPIFQYTLTELFDSRVDNTLTNATYHAMGGVRGALRRNADEVYAQLTTDEQAVARQLFLRLVTITDNDEWSRRRVPASEIVALDGDLVAMEGVIDAFGRRRFLAFDRDPVRDAPTVEVAHEALLWEWPQLRNWIEDGRNDVQRHASLAAAMHEWRQAEHDADYLLAGARLAEYERWRATSTLKLTAEEQAYLDASVAHAQQARTGEEARVAYEGRLRRRARRRLWALIAVVVALVAVVAGVLVATRGGGRRTVALAFAGRGLGGIDDLQAAGFDRAQRELGFQAVDVVPPFTGLEGALRQAAAGADLVIIGNTGYAQAAAAVAPSFPHAVWAYLDAAVPGAASVRFAHEQAAFLAGAAAALTSRTGSVGFVGGFQTDVVERFRAGYEAGARAVKPEVEVLAAYVSLGYEGFSRRDYAQTLAARMYERGADVVYGAAGTAGFGVLDAARAESALQGRQLWGIGADTDHYYDVDASLRPFVLTSTINKYDIAVYNLIKDYLDGRLEPTTSRELTLGDGVMDLSASGGFLATDTRAVLDRLKTDIIEGRRTVPAVPTGPLDPPAPPMPRFTAATVTFDGASCRYDGPTSVSRGDVLRIDFANTTGADALLAMNNDDSSSVAVQIPARGGGQNRGYAYMVPGRHQVLCFSGVAPGASQVAGPTLSTT
ncbi:MAG TPA: BMP family ABC transporter substrate-binding protein, partial [Acidimicrobiales bacterium]